MRQSDDLFRLVKSLTKSEKRYFKLFASMQGKNKKYLLLFDAVDQQNVYDEAALKEEFKREKFVRQLAVTKGYLYNLVLKSLRLYHSGANVQAQLREMLSNIELLQQKGLNDLALKTLEKAKRLASKHEKFLSLIALYQWEKALRPAFRSTKEAIAYYENELQTLLEKLDNALSYEFLLHKAANAVLHDHLRTAEEEAYMETVMSDPLLQDPEQARSFMGRLHFHWTHATYQYSRNEFSAALVHARKMVDLFEEEPHRLHEKMDWYLIALGNCLTLLRQAGMEQQFWETVAHIRSFAENYVEPNRTKNPSIAAKTYEVLYLYLAALYISRAEYRKCADLAPDIEEGVARYGEMISDNFKRKLYHNLSFAFLALEDYDRSLEYNNKILMEPEPFEGRQTYYAARLLNLVLHYELGNMQLLESLVVSTYRYLLSRDSAYKLETSIIGFFKQLPRITTQSELIYVFIQLRDRLAELEDEPLEQNAFRYFAYVDWLESKIQNRPFAEVYRQRRASIRASEMEKVA